jgi:hypothetical protein
MHVPQHSSQVSVDVLNLFQASAPEHELDKRVLHQILGGLMIPVSQKLSYRSVNNCSRLSSGRIAARR